MEKKIIRIEKSAEVRPLYGTEMHTHPMHELYFLVSGQRRYFLGHSIYDVYPGNLVIIPRTHLHKTSSPTGKGYDRYVVYFHDEDVQDLITLLGRGTYDDLMQDCCLQFSADVCRQLQQLLEQMYAERKEQREFAAAFYATHLRSLLLTALRHGKRRSPCAGETADKIQEVARYISENYHQPLTLHDCAQLAYMEDTYFSKQFKRLTGFGFQEYLTQIRIRAAELLLLQTELSVSQISEACGFSSSNYFGDAFRRSTGLSPSAYRNIEKDK